MCTIYHQYCVPTILQVVTPISFLKKVILYRFKGEGLLSTLLHLICFFNIVIWKQRLIGFNLFYYFSFQISSSTFFTTFLFSII